MPSKAQMISLPPAQYEIIQQALTCTNHTKPTGIQPHHLKGP